MKRIILSLATVLTATTVSAQAANDSVYVGPSSTNNVFYSLANDSVTTSAVNNWHLGFATAVSPNSSLVATVQFNTLIASVYEIPDADPTDFENVDTAGFSTWTPLYNSEHILALGGALNSVATAMYDYGFGTYNMTSHNVDAGRVFLAKIGSSFVKFKIDLLATQGKYQLTFDNLDNTNLTVQDIALAAYASKNFVYFNLTTEALVDREPASASWDLLFGSYHSLVGTTMYPVAGIMQNTGVEAVQVGGVNTATYVDFSSHTFTDTMNVIGSDWKTYNGSGYAITPNTVYFVKDKSGDIWKVVMRGYAGGSQGKMSFSKEKISSLGVDENGAEIFASLYPNPAANSATVVVNNVNGSIKVFSFTGALVYAQQVNASGLTAIEIPVADFANGAYQVVCTSGSVVSAQRLIVQH